MNSLNRLPPGQPLRFQAYLRKAQALLNERPKIGRLIVRGADQLRAGKGRRIHRLRDDVRTLVSMTAAWYRNEYRDIRPVSLTVALAGLLYFVLPTDVVPDFLVGFGLIDDAAVIAYVAKVLQSEMGRFRLWHRKHTAAVESELDADMDDGDAPLLTANRPLPRRTPVIPDRRAGKDRRASLR